MCRERLDEISGLARRRASVVELRKPLKVRAPSAVSSTMTGWMNRAVVLSMSLEPVQRAIPFPEEDAFIALVGVLRR